MGKNIDEARLEEIHQQMIDAGVSDLFGTKKEVRHLPELMYADEKLLYATSGFVDKGTVLVVVTDQRLMFVNHGMIYGTDFREIPFEKINGVSYSTGIALAKVAIDNCANTTMIDQVSKKTAPEFVEILKSAIASEKEVSSPEPTAVFSVADELIKFKQLLDAGVLTQEEFDTQKAKLLAQ